MENSETDAETLEAHKTRAERKGAQYFQAMILVIVLGGLVLYFFPPETQERSFLKAGDIAEPFDLPLVDGSGTMSWEKDFKGKVVLLNYWATWCKPCLEEMPALDRLHDRLEAEGLTVVAISEDDVIALPRDFNEENDLSFPVLWDDDHRVASRWGTFKYPETYVIGRDGVVVQKLFGPADWDSTKAIEFFRGLLTQGEEGNEAAEIPTDPGAARSPERGSMRQKIEQRGGAPSGSVQ
ncbi:MAG: TlpA family protein disulfide reductase [Chrysiogenetes bacterium]|nr:TlpA family protein disulfide reductase [Chrysiogenetes bacterium]